MAKQDDYVRYTIRVPASLYARVQDAAGEKSVNAEIVARLEDSFSLDEVSDFPGFSAAEKASMLHNQLEQARAKLNNSIELPESLRKRLGSRAAETGRMLEEEAIQALEKAFPPPTKTFGDYMENLRATLNSGEVHPTLVSVFQGLLRSYESQAERDPSWLKKRPEYQAQPGSWPVNFTPADENDDTD